MNQKMRGVNYIALLSVFLFAGAGTFMNAAVQTMIEAWPDVSVTTVRMVVSLPPLVSLPVMLITGGMVGKKLSYRFCAIFGTLLIALGGVAPFFVSSSWTLVLAFRAILGVGVGFLGMRNALGINVVAIRTGDSLNAMPMPQTAINEEDVLLVVVKDETLAKLNRR